MKRKVDLVILSDVHLGTYGSRADQLKLYLKSIKPKTLVLNGDFIDIWQFRKSYFPKSHLKVIKLIMEFAKNGSKIIYITGNHDELLRKFTDLHIGNLELCNKKILELENGERAWIFHGDIFDFSVQHSKWIAKLGGYGYDFLIMLNVLVNWVLERFGYEKYSFSKKIKNSVKKAVNHVNSFERVAAELAIEQKYDYVVCGHIHQPQMRTVSTPEGSTIYLNSGDWVENLTSLEYHQGQWSIYQHEEITVKKKKNALQPDVELSHDEHDETDDAEEVVGMNLDELILNVTTR